MTSLRNDSEGPQAEPLPANAEAAQPPLQRESAPGQGVGEGAAPFSAVAEALRSCPQWCVAGPDKRPLTAEGYPASVTDPATWTDFDTASRAAAASGSFPGFVLRADDPFACIDLDMKDDTTPEQVQRFESIVATFDSYTERSRSGRGWHIWVEGGIGKGRKRDGVEVYSQERFIICTGDVVRDRPITPRQQLLDNLVSQMPAPPSAAALELVGDDCADWSLAERASMDAGELGRLFRGDWQGRYPSQSEADLALVKLLMPFTDSPRECWLTFRHSKLGEREKASRADYARSTMALAAQHLANDAGHIAHGRMMAANLARNPRHFRLLGDDDLRHLPPHRWLVKGIMPETGIGTIFGPSGTFKSFLALDLMAHVSNGQAWFGRRVAAAPAVYVPFEGQGGIPKRVAAWRLLREHQGYSATTNMRFITEPMNLRQQAHRDKLVATLIDNGWAGGVLCIDTLAQAGPGIDENTSQGMGEMIAIFQELQQRLGGVVLVVHHSGKSEKAGMRGWSGLLGALDFAVRCWRDDEWAWFEGQFVLDKVKDGEAGLAFDFSMARVCLGHDEDGDEVSSLTVTPPTPRQKDVAPDEAQIARDDDDFLDGWVRMECKAGRFPSGRSLESQRSMMKDQRVLTQARLRNAIERLKNFGRLVEERNGPTGNKWLRPVDLNGPSA